MSGELKHECGLGSVCGYEKAAESCHDLLYQVQHRGEEWCGVASFDGEKIYLEKEPGHVEWAINETVRQRLPGYLAIGHNRYSTSGPSSRVNAQPHLVPTIPLAFCSNGDIAPFCYQEQRANLENNGMAFKSQNDGELIAKYLAYHLSKGQGAIEAIEQLMKEMVGAYSALLLYDGKIIAFRDPLGIRPLVMGRREKTWLTASETCALDIVLAHDDVCEIAPGEIVIFEPNKDPRRFQLIKTDYYRHCVFELIYFSRPDSIVFGLSVQKFRKITGQLLAAQKLVPADAVMAVPDASNATAIGYSRASHIPYDIGLIRNHYVGRTFILPGQESRDSGVRKKHNPVRGDDVVNEQKIVLIDDSIVRGTTSRKLVGMLRRAGAREIHLRIASPPIKSPCFYGIDMKTNEELTASQRSLEEIREFTTADSLDYLAYENLKEAVRLCGGNPDNFCYACFDGKYPTAI